MVMKKHTLYSSLLILGASVLLFRTIRLLTVENGWEVLANWVIILTIIEMAIDIACLGFSLQWLISNKLNSKSKALRYGAVAAIFHAFRVLIYVLGRTDLLLNFDVKPQFKSTHEVNMFWVYFAAILSILGILGVVIISIIMRRKNKNSA